MQGLWTKHKVDKRCTPRDALTFLAGNTAANTDHDALALLFQRAPAAEFGEDLFLRFFAYRTRVNEQEVGLVRISRELVTMRFAQDIRHFVRVILVHLATHGLDVELFAHACYRIKPIASSFTRMRCAARSGVILTVSITISAFSGASYGSEIPVNSLILPARASA